MTTVNEHNDFLSSYWSDLHLASNRSDDVGGPSLGIQQSVESPREKAERLRKIIRFLSSMRSSKLIDQSLYLSLVTPVQQSYGNIVDDMNKSEGLNNNADAIMAIVSGSANESHSWVSSFKSDDDIEQASLFKEIIENAKEEDNTVEKTLKYTSIASNAKVKTQTKNGPQESEIKKPNIPNGNNFTRGASRVDSGQCEEVTESPIGKPINGKGELFSQPKFNIQTKDSSLPRHQSAFVKRKCSPSNEAPNKHLKTNLGRTQSVMQAQHLSLETENVTDANGNYDSYKRRQKGVSIIYNKNKNQQLDETEVNGENENETPLPEDTNPFMTARDQYIIDQRKKNNRLGAPNDNKSIRPCDYGQTKKSLGTRRGTLSRFVPPVMNREENGYASNKRAAYSSAVGGQHTNKDCQDERLKNIEPRMIEMIENEIMDHGPSITWDDIAGLEFAKNTIQEIVIWPMLRPDIFTGLRGPPKGLLLFGPPGTGKTLIGKCIASQSKATFFSISASSLTSKWIGEGEKMVRALFAVARCQESAVVFIDEIDSLLTQRTDGEHEATRRIKTEFLVQLDGATTKSEERLLVVGATNRPQELDEAARRRLVKRLYIPLPDDDARKQIVYNLVKEQNCSLNEADYAKIVENTQGYSGADMANLCREAALGPIRTMTAKDIRYIKPDEVRPMLYKDFEMALRSIRPSVSQKDLESYITWNKLYGSGAF